MHLSLPARGYESRRTRQGQTAGNCIASDFLKGSDMVLDSLYLISFFEVRENKTQQNDQKNGTDVDQVNEGRPYNEGKTI